MEVAPVVPERNKLGQLITGGELTPVLEKFLLSKCYMLASCNKQLRSLFEKETKNWKSPHLFSRKMENQELQASMYEGFREFEQESLRQLRYRQNLPVYWRNLHFHILIYPTKDIKTPEEEKQYLHDNEETEKYLDTLECNKTWGQLEVLVRSYCDGMRAKGHSEFKIQIQAVRIVQRRQAQFGIDITTPITLYEAGKKEQDST